MLDLNRGPLAAEKEHAMVKVGRPENRRKEADRGVGEGAGHTMVLVHGHNDDHRIIDHPAGGSTRRIRRVSDTLWPAAGQLGDVERVGFVFLDQR